MSTPPQAQAKSYIGFTPTGGNPGYRTQRSVDQSRLGGAAMDIGNSGEEISLYGYVFRNPNATPAYINIFGVPASKATDASPIIGRILVPGMNNLPNVGLGPMLFTPYYYSQPGMSMAASTDDHDGGALGNAPVLPIYFELIIA